jgi:hypothetical protein
MLKKIQKNIMYNMELNLSELDNVNTMNPYDTFDYNSYEEKNGENYWEKPKIKENQTKRKKVSFNDILSNMNLVVNKQGVLQFMSAGKEQIYNEQPLDNYNYNQNEFTQQNYNQTHPNKNLRQGQKPQEPLDPGVKHSQEPLDPGVKHSYIYNKYFKDYADPNLQKQGPRVPKTIDEYHKMLLDDRKKAIEHKLKMEEIKSKKLLFTSAPGSTSNPRNIQPTKNNLRRMNFG